MGTHLPHDQVADTSLESLAQGFSHAARPTAGNGNLVPQRARGKAGEGVRQPEQKDALPRAVNRDGAGGSSQRVIGLKHLVPLMLLVAEHRSCTFLTLSIVAGAAVLPPAAGQEQQHQRATDSIQATQPGSRGWQLAKPQLGIPFRVP